MSDQKLNFTHDELKSSLKDALAKSIEVKDNGRFYGYPGSNSLRSARFVWEVSKQLRRRYESLLDVVSFVQEVKDDGTKIGGEWLLDIAIANTLPLVPTKSKALVNTGLIWAVESEYSTRRGEFAKDFGKLLCVRAENRLYLNGFNQLLGNEDRFIKDRVQETLAFLSRVCSLEVKGQPNGFQTGNLFLGFWPSPERGPKGTSSLWDVKKKSELITGVRLFRFNIGCMGFDEIN